VENRLKTLVNDSTPKRWVRYEVRAIYTGQAAPPVGTPSPVHPFETQFAAKLTWSYQLKKQRSTDPTQLEDDNAAVGDIPARDSGDVESVSQGYPT
jgi:hypothetical protein